MSAGKHTPGPWAWNESGYSLRPQTPGDGIYQTIIQLEGHGMVRRDCDIDAMIAEGEANRHLIAAAPDLLAALQVMLRDYTAVHDIGDVEMQPALYQARAAIAKATGQEGTPT